MSGYIGNIPIPQATQTRDVFTATAGQTSFATSGYTPGFLDVYLNGVKLIDGTDFTASNGSDVVLATGATLNDTLEVLSYSTFEVNSQNFTGNTVIDNVDINGGTIDGTVIGGSTPAAISGTTGQFGTSLNVDGTITSDGLTVDSDTAQIEIKSFNPRLTFNDDSAVGAAADKFIIQSVSGQSLGDYEFVMNNDQTSSADVTVAKFYGSGDISFYEDTGTTPKFFWDASAERLGIGTSSPAEKIHIDGGAAAGYLKATNNASTQGIEVGISAAGDGIINVQDAAALRLFTSDAEAMRIDSSGNVLCGSDGGGDIGSSTKRFKDLYLSGGVYLGGTGAANYLDDYEEGEWTPTGNGITLGTSYGYYVKVGKLVTLIGHISFPSTSDGSNAIVDGIPFTADDNILGGQNFKSGGSLGYSTANFTNGFSCYVRNDTSIQLANGSADLDNVDLSGKSVRFQISYYAA